MKYTTLSLTLLTLLPTALTTTTGVGEHCIKLKGNKKYTWKADGDFKGEGLIDSKTHCFGPGSGGISFGTPKAITKGAPGNTRLECHFPSNPSDADFYNCNLSLVDGFSAAVTCTVKGGGWPNSQDVKKPLGCKYDLMAGCPPENWDEGCQCCKNHKGASVSSIEAVSKVFQQCKAGKENPNSAEVFFNMQGAYKFSKKDFPITCEVNRGKKVKIAERRELAAMEEEAVVEKREEEEMMEKREAEPATAQSSWSSEGHQHGSRDIEASRDPAHGHGHAHAHHVKDVKARSLAEGLA